MKSQTITVASVGNNQGFTATQTYTYDSLNRLESAGETIAGQQTWQQAFTYDRYGNRRFNESLTTTNGTGYNQAAVNPTISTATNRISSAGYSYDAAGNLTGDTSGKQFFYDAENHQKEVRNGSGAVIGLYLYDGEGKRVKKVVPGGETTVFVYDGGGKLVAEYSTQTAANPAVNYLTQDHLGSPRVITDNVGKVVARKDFGAFGDETFTPQRTEQLGYKPENIRQDYTGYQKDDETQLEFAEARYYNTLHGRFTSIDPLTASANVKDPQTFNRYTYAMNSPYKFTDPLGLISSGTAANGGQPQEYARSTGSTLVDKVLHGFASKREIQLLQWHISNGTALGYTYENAVGGQMSAQRSSDTGPKRKRKKRGQIKNEPNCTPPNGSSSDVSVSTAEVSQKKIDEVASRVRQALNAGLSKERAIVQKDLHNPDKKTQNKINETFVPARDGEEVTIPDAPDLNNNRNAFQGEIEVSEETELAIRDNRIDTKEGVNEIIRDEKAKMQGYRNPCGDAISDDVIIDALSKAVDRGITQFMNSRPAKRN